MITIVVDALWYMHSWWHVQKHYKTSTGIQTGLLFTLKNIVDLCKKYSTNKVKVAWDSKYYKRYELDPTYKGDRHNKDLGFDDSLFTVLNNQQQEIRDFYNTLGINSYEVYGAEADDIIYSICKDEIEQSDCGGVMIVSRDRDLWSCVALSPKVVIYQGSKVPIVTQENVYDHIKESFKVENVLLEYFQLFRSFRGDKSDTIKGIPYLDSEVIIYLLNKSDKTIEGIYNCIESDSYFNSTATYVKFKEDLLRYRSQVELNYKLLQFMDVREDLNSLKFEDKRNKELFIELATKYEMKSLLKYVENKFIDIFFEKQKQVFLA